MSAENKFREAVSANIAQLRADNELKQQSQQWLVQSAKRQYSYNFRWMGRPIIQYPQDMIAMQEILWDVRPDLIIETGIAHGGSLVFYASLCELMGHGEVLGIDIDIRPHNRASIESHAMSKRIRMIEGSSIDPVIVDEVTRFAQGMRVLVVLDSNHTHAHVLAELLAYAPLVSVGSYCVVFDTVVEDMPVDAFPDRPWGLGNNPKTAVREFLGRDGRFMIDRDIEAKIQITVAPDGFLRRVR